MLGLSLRTKNNESTQFVLSGYNICKHFGQRSDRQYVGSDLYPNCLPLVKYSALLLLLLLKKHTHTKIHINFECATMSRFQPELCPQVLNESVSNIKKHLQTN